MLVGKEALKGESGAANLSLEFEHSIDLSPNAIRLVKLVTCTASNLQCPALYYPAQFDFISLGLSSKPPPYPILGSILYILQVSQEHQKLHIQHPQWRQSSILISNSGFRNSTLDGGNANGTHELESTVWRTHSLSVGDILLDISS